MTTPERETLLGQVARAIAQFQSATDLVDDAAAAHLGINRTDLRCLGLLYAHGPLPAGRLGTAAHLSPGATTAAIDRLERSGYARRARANGDRRGVLVELTPAAHEGLAAVYGPVGRAGMARLMGYSDAELHLLLDFLTDGYRFQAEEAARIRTMPTIGDDPAQP